MHRRSLVRTAILAVAAIWLPLAPAQATVMERYDEARLFREATLVVVGLAGRAEVSREGRLLLTDVRVTVDRVVAGGPARAGDAIVVRTPGGELEGQGQIVAGAPRLVEGARYVLFLRGSAAGRHEVVGWTQGMYVVGTGTQGQAWIRPAPTDAMLVDLPGSTAPAAALPAEGMALDAWLARHARTR